MQFSAEMAEGLAYLHYDEVRRATRGAGVDDAGLHNNQINRFRMYTYSPIQHPHPHSPSQSPLSTWRTATCDWRTSTSASTDMSASPTLVGGGRWGAGGMGGRDASCRRLEDCAGLAGSTHNAIATITTTVHTHNCQGLAIKRRDFRPMGEIVTPSFSSASNFAANAVPSSRNASRQEINPPAGYMPAMSSKPSSHVPGSQVSSLTIDTCEEGDSDAGTTWIDQIGHRVTLCGSECGVVVGGREGSVQG